MYPFYCYLPPRWHWKLIMQSEILNRILETEHHSIERERERERDRWNTKVKLPIMNVQSWCISMTYRGYLGICLADVIMIAWVILHSTIWIKRCIPINPICNNNAFRNKIANHKLLWSVRTWKLLLLFNSTRTAVRAALFLRV